jgi:hypothetical protein
VGRRELDEFLGESSAGDRVNRFKTGGYEDNILPSGLPAGSPEEALDCVCGLYLNDPPAGPYPRRINGADHLGIRKSTARGHHSGDALILASG